MKATKVPVLNEVRTSDLAELVFSVMMRLEVARRMTPEDVNDILTYDKVEHACRIVMLDECAEWE